MLTGYSFGTRELNKALRLLRQAGIKPKKNPKLRNQQIWYDCYLGCGIELALYNDKGFCDLYAQSSQYRGTEPSSHEYVQLDVIRFYFRPQSNYSDHEPVDWSPGQCAIVGLNGAYMMWEADGKVFEQVVRQ